ncbi:MAG: AAA family ATPase, partial [Dichotomicrobium sp.]
VDQHPHCVLLLDEIEKAHPDLFNVLLQVMDHGKLTDHNGKQIDFRNVVLIMTTNAGAQDLAKSAIGFNRSTREGEDQDAIRKLFTPEFRNRLDAVIPFSNLGKPVISKVIEKFVFQLEAQLADRNVSIELTEAAKDWLGEHGYDEQFGARPMSRVIQQHIKQPLAEELLFGKLEGGGTVRVDAQEKDGRMQLVFEIVESRAKPKSADSSGSGESDEPNDDDDGGEVEHAEADSQNEVSGNSGKTGGEGPSSPIPKVPLAP